ncbi:MAG TPA: nucleotidyltransferase family protein [Acidimicrobiales bacterium]|nr:nucleotidyltransferase family protein [Acidimicrobiales bacterium]
MGVATAELLWAGCRPAPDADAVRAAVAAGADVSLAAELAVGQRVSPLLWRALSEAGCVPNGDGEPWVDLLRNDAVRCRAHALLILPELAPRVLVPLAAEGLTPLIYKGAALVDRYPAPGLRPMDDVDLVLPREEVDAAVSALLRVGWRVVPPVPGSHHHETILVNDAVPGLPIELHRALADWRERSNRLTSLDMWRWRSPGRVFDEAAYVLPIEEEIVAVAAHAAKPFHVFDRLVWAVDVAVVIEDAERRGRAVDWERVDQLARRARCRTGLAVALTQAGRLGATSPPWLRDCPAVRARRRALLPLLGPEWPLVERGWGTRTRLRYALVDDWRQRVTLLAAQLLEDGPTGIPRNALHLGSLGVHRWWQLRQEVSQEETTTRPGGPLGA